MLTNAHEAQMTAIRTQDASTLRDPSFADVTKDTEVMAGHVKVSQRYKVFFINHCKANSSPLSYTNIL